jgi:hypothetical protein
LDIGCGYANSIIHKHLGYHKICARWVAKQQAHAEMYMQLLQQHHEREAFLQWTVTGNETWVHHYEPAGKCQSIKWKHISLTRTKKLKSVPSADKVMMTPP